MYQAIVTTSWLPRWREQRHPGRHELAPHADWRRLETGPPGHGGETGQAERIAPRI